jgi:glycosyltransferase involved in cell wall biosynthesis
MKRILIFSLTYHPFMAGAELAIKNITDRMDPDQYSFDMITLRLDSSLARRERVGNVDVYRIGFTRHSPSARDLVRFPMYLNKVFYPLLACFKALRLHRTRGYAAMWSSMTYMGFPAVMVKWFYRRLPMILTLQDGDTPEYIAERRRIRVVGWLFRQIFIKADIIQVISNYLGKFARDQGATCPVVVIPNGADIKKFSIFNVQFSNNEELRKKNGIKLNERVIITVSRLVEKNGVDVIISAIQHLPEDTRLIIIGDGPLRKTYELQTKACGLTTRIQFLGDIRHDFVPGYLALADVFVRPSRSEGMGSAFIEAMAAGVPVIGTAVGGIPDFLHDGQTGLICVVDNPKDLARKILRILNDRDLRERLIVAASQMVQASYDWGAIARRMEREVFTATGN